MEMAYGMNLNKEKGCSLKDNLKTVREESKNCTL